MSKVLFVNGNLYGHINPTIPVVEELVERGEEVWYFCSKEFEERIRKAGAVFVDYGETVSLFLKNYKPMDHHPFFMLLEYMIRYHHTVLPILLEKIKENKFDYVVYDSVLGGGYFLKQILDIPVFCSNSSFAMKRLPLPERMLEKGFHPQLDAFYKVLEMECEKWNVKVPSAYDFFINEGDLNLVYTSKEFNSDEDFDKSYQFVGPSIRTRNEKIEFPFDKINGEKVIYISLGTINTDFNDFYNMCIEAFSGLEYTVVMSVGKKCNISKLSEIPDNFIVKNYVPQLEILERANVFISHAGFNSVSEALLFGVPVIAIPMMNDQYMVANRLEQTNTGITLNMKEISKEKILNAVQTILGDNKYYSSSLLMGATLGKGRGYEKAADSMLQFVKENANGHSK